MWCHKGERKIGKFYEEVDVEITVKFGGGDYGEAHIYVEVTKEEYDLLSESSYNRKNAWKVCGLENLERRTTEFVAQYLDSGESELRYDGWEEDNGDAEPSDVYDWRFEFILE